MTAPVAHAMWHMGRRLGPQVGTWTCWVKEKLQLPHYIVRALPDCTQFLFP